MTKWIRTTHNIVTFSDDERIVSAVQEKIGAIDYSTAVRYIIREYARLSDVMIESSRESRIPPDKARRVLKPRLS